MVALTVKVVHSIQSSIAIAITKILGILQLRTKNIITHIYIIILGLYSNPKRFKSSV